MSYWIPIHPKLMQNFLEGTVDFTSLHGRFDNVIQKEYLVRKTTHFSGPKGPSFRKQINPHFLGEEKGSKNLHRFN